MTNEEMLVAIKEMFAEEHKITDAKFEAAQKATDVKFAAIGAKIEAAQKATDAKFATIDAKIEAAQKETIQQIKALLENGVEKQIKLLAEGHAQILSRLPDSSKQAEIEARVTTLEHIAEKHTKQIEKLQRA